MRGPTVSAAAGKLRAVTRLFWVMKIITTTMGGSGDPPAACVSADGGRPGVLSLAAMAATGHVNAMATAFALPPAETMTARMVVMLTPADKRSLEERARAAGLTPSEFCRRAIVQYDPQVDEAIFDAFLTEFEANNRAMSATLREANDRLDATLAAIDARQVTQEAELAALRAKYAAA